MIRVAVVGAGGRMGRTLIQAVTAAEGVELTAATEKAEGDKAEVIEKYKAISDKKLQKAREAMEQAKKKITDMQKKLETAKKEEERLRIREKKVVQALQRAREVIASMKKGGR